MAQTINFSDFGTQFVSLAANERNLYNSFGPELQRARIPAMDRHAGPADIAHVWGNGQVLVNTLKVRRNDADSTAGVELAFDVTFRVHLTLHVRIAGIAQENYEVDADVRLRIIAETWDVPLRLYFRIRPVVPNDIEVHSRDVGGWFHIAQQYGLDAEVAAAFAEKFNEQLPETNDTRSIQVEQMILKASPPNFHPS